MQGACATGKTIMHKPVARRIFFFLLPYSTLKVGFCPEPKSSLGRFRLFYFVVKVFGVRVNLFSRRRKQKGRAALFQKGALPENQSTLMQEASCKPVSAASLTASVSEIASLIKDTRSAMVTVCTGPNTRPICSSASAL